MTEQSFHHEGIINQLRRVGALFLLIAATTLYVRAARHTLAATLLQSRATLLQSRLMVGVKALLVRYYEGESIVPTND